MSTAPRHERAALEVGQRQPIGFALRVAIQLGDQARAQRLWVARPGRQVAVVLDAHDIVVAGQRDRLAAGAAHQCENVRAPARVVGGALHAQVIGVSSEIWVPAEQVVEVLRESYLAWRVGDAGEAHQRKSQVSDERVPHVKSHHRAGSSNTRTVTSRTPTASFWPSGLNASASTLPAPMFSFAASSPVVGFQNWMSPLRLPVARTVPSGEKAIPTKRSCCCCAEMVLTN